MLDLDHHSVQRSGTRKVGRKSSLICWGSLGASLVLGHLCYLGQILGFGFTLYCVLIYFQAKEPKLHFFPAPTDATFLFSGHCSSSSPLQWLTESSVSTSTVTATMGALAHCLSCQGQQDLSCDRKAICKEGFGWWEVWVAIEFSE